MSPWQLLRANRASQAALSHRVHHGPGALVHYSTAPAAAAVAPDGSRSFCLSREKVTLQQLNRRLASYLQQVRCLEAANQKLERQIQEELDRKCPTELSELDGHLRTASLLQDQISERLAAQARVKLQLLGAELTVFDFSVRCEKERERRGCVEAELSDLRLLEEELKVHRLPELQSLLSDHTQHLTELRRQHRQNVQGLLAQTSGGVAVEMQAAESSDLIQQLDDLRQTSATLLDHNQSDFWFNTQVSMLSSPEVTFDPPAGSEAVQAELEELRTTAASLEEERAHLQALNQVLEASGLEQTSSFVLQLELLQQRADGLCTDLDSALQSAAQQAADHEALLDVKSRLETEIRNYRRLLDGLSAHGASNSANVASFHATTSPSAFRRNLPVSVQGGNLRMTQVQTVSRVKSSTETSIKSSGSFHNSDGKRTGASSSIRQSSHATDHQFKIRQSSDEGAVVEASTPEINMAEGFSTVGCAAVQATPERFTSKQTTTETNKTGTSLRTEITETISTHVETHTTETETAAETQSEISGSIQAENRDPAQVVSLTRAEAVGDEGEVAVVSDEMTKMDDSNIQREEKMEEQEVVEVEGSLLDITSDQSSALTDASSCEQNKVMEDADTESDVATASSSSPDNPESKTAQGITTLVPDTQSEASLQANKSERNIQTEITKNILCAEPELKREAHFQTHTDLSQKNQELAQAVSFNPPEAVGDVAVRASVVSVEAQVSAELTPIDDNDIQRQEKTKEQVVVVEGSGLSDASSREQNKVMEDADTESDVATASSCSPDNPESETAQGITTLVPDTQSAGCAAFTSKLTTTEASLQANKREINTQTEITKTILCAEPELKREAHFQTHTDLSQKNQELAQVVSLTPAEATVTASVVSEEVQVSAELTPIDDNDIQRQEKTKEQVVVVEGSGLSDAASSEQNKVMEDADTESDVATASSCSPDNHESKTVQGITTLVPDTQSAGCAAFTSKLTTTEASLQANEREINIQTEITKTILCAEPELKREAHFQTHTDLSQKNQELAQVVSLNPSEAVGDVAVRASVVSEEAQVSAELTPIDDNDTQRQEETKEQEEVVVEGSGLSDASSRERNKVMEDADTESDVATASSSRPDNPESKTAQGITTLVPDTQSEASLQANGREINIQTEITKNIHQNQETESLISAEMNCTEDSTEVKNQDPALVVSLTPSEAVGDVAVTASVVSEEVQVSAELTLMDDNDTETQEKTEEQEVVEEEGSLLCSTTLSEASNSKQNGVMEDADPGSSFVMDSSSGTEIYNKVEVEVNKVNGFHIINEVKVDPTELDDEMITLASQEEVASTAESKNSTSLPSSSITEENALNVPVPCLSPEPCLSPVETEVLMNMTDQVFCPVDPNVRSPNPLLSPEMFLSPNDSDTCFSPVENKVCLSPSGEEDEEACLILTEANAYVRPVEKYILATKEEGQSLSFSTDQALPEDDRNVSISHGDTLCFGSFEGGGTPNGKNINSKPTIRGLDFRGPGGRSIIADKEEQLGFGGLYRKSVGNARSPRDKEYRDTSGTADDKDVQNPGSTCGSEDQKETPSMTMGQRNTERVFVKSASFGSVPANDPARELAASFGGTAANSSGKVNGNGDAKTTAGVQGRFSRGSGEWMVYGGSLGRTSSPSTGSKENSSGATIPATSQSETGRFSSRGSGEWMVYGSLGRKSSLDGGTSLPSEGKEERPSAPPKSETTPPETGRFSSRGGGEWMVHGGSLERKSSLPRTRSEEIPSVSKLPATSRPKTGRFSGRGSGEWMVYGDLGRKSSLDGGRSLPSEGKEEGASSAMFPATSQPETTRFASGGSGEWMVYSGSLKRNSSPNTESRESLPPATLLATSPPETGRFGSRGSGEWRVYGGSTGRMSSWAGSDSLPNADSEESPSVAMQLATSPPGSLGAGRFGSGGSGEWRFYGGSPRRLSSADRVSTNCSHMISPPSSHTGSGRRLSSAGSGGRLSSGGVVRRSSSVGSGGRLSSSSGRYASTGSGEGKPVYSSAGGRRSSAGSAGRSGGGGATSSQRAPSPGGRMSAGSGGWLSTSGGGSKLSSAGSSDRISSGGRVSSSSGSGRTNSTGGRVISSSDRPIRSTGSGAGGSKERISVCKMAALSISAAGRERSQDRRTQQQQQQRAAAASPLVQRWLTTGVGVTSADPGGLDDIMRL